MDQYKIEEELTSDLVKVEIKVRSLVHEELGSQETGHIVKKRYWTCAAHLHSKLEQEHTTLELHAEKKAQAHELKSIFRRYIFLCINGAIAPGKYW